MSNAFFKDLNLSEPATYLGIGSGIDAPDVLKVKIGWCLKLARGFGMGKRGSALFPIRKPLDDHTQNNTRETGISSPSVYVCVYLRLIFP